jgi:DNA-binding MarR family transcriptional regulator
VANDNRPSDDALNDFVLSVFRLNGFLLHAADRLTAGSGLTTARWQVLGAVLHEPLTVSSVARNMGLARQSVQRVADALVAEGLCEFLPNPAHRRAKLLASTDRGLKSIQHLRPRVMAWSKRVRKLVDDGALTAAKVAVQNLLSALLAVEGQLLRDARCLQGIAT